MEAKASYQFKSSCQLLFAPHPVEVADHLLSTRPPKLKITELTKDLFSNNVEKRKWNEFLKIENPRDILDAIERSLTEQGIDHQRLRMKKNLFLRGKEMIQILPSENSSLNRLAKKMLTQYQVRFFFDPSFKNDGGFWIEEKTILISKFSAFLGRPDYVLFHEIRHASHYNKIYKKGDSPLVNGMAMLSKDDKKEVNFSWPWQTFNWHYSMQMTLDEINTWNQDFKTHWNSLKKLFLDGTITKRTLKKYLEPHLQFDALMIILEHSKNLVQLQLQALQKRSEIDVFWLDKDPNSLVTFYQDSKKRTIYQYIPNSFTIEHLTESLRQELNAVKPESKKLQNQVLSRLIDGPERLELRYKIAEKYLLELNQKIENSIRDLKEKQKSYLALMSAFGQFIERDQPEQVLSLNEKFESSDQSSIESIRPYYPIDMDPIEYLKLMFSDDPKQQTVFDKLRSDLPAVAPLLIQKSRGLEDLLVAKELSLESVDLSTVVQTMNTTERLTGRKKDWNYHVLKLKIRSKNLDLEKSKGEDLFGPQNETELFLEWNGDSKSTLYKALLYLHSSDIEVVKADLLSLPDTMEFVGGTSEKLNSKIVTLFDLISAPRFQIHLGNMSRIVRAIQNLESQEMGVH